MTFGEIACFAPVNDVDHDKVEAIKESIKKNGFVGMPILVAKKTGILVTGSHRLEALKALANDDDADAYDIYEMEVAEDVQDIIDEWCEKNGTTIDDVDFSSLSNIFAGTWVEQYKDEMEEW